MHFRLSRVESKLSAAFGLLYGLCVAGLVLVAVINHDALTAEQFEATREASTRLLVQVQKRPLAPFEIGRAHV